ncbi:zona pellucida sperm-binding protein 4 isoform X2 [Equus przewalskii]|uniref:Zona pellucida sperm-binding protein 4 n=1 Tax=Equus przewalskii TaxID=9798 RepID=A0ABM4P0E0_EQUPR
MWLLQSVLLCFSLSLALGGQRELEAPAYPGVLHCGLRSFQFTVNLSQETATPPALIAWDNRGMPRRLQNDSDCGTWVREDPGSSVVLEASYSSCYVTQWDSHYIMPVGVERTDAAGHRTVTKMKLLECPMDFLGDCKERGCCYNSEVNSCYYGNTVTSRCTQDGHFSIAVSRNVTSPPLLLSSVHLAFRNDSECNPVMATHAFALFRFPFTSCGTTRRVTGDQAVYENELVATRDVRTWSHGSITRDSIFRFQVSCSYSVSSNAFPVNVQVFTLPPPLPETQPGPLTLELQIAKDKHYISYYNVSDYPVVKLLQDPIYVEVSILHRTDPYLGLMLHQCWATPSTNPLHQPQWPLLVKGCPYTGDSYQTQLIPVQKALDLPFPSHYQRFSIFTFSFVDSVAKRAFKGLVYLHCSASICQPAGTPPCMITCPVTRRRRSSDIRFQNSTASISSKGPMILLQATKDSSEKLHKYSTSPVDSQSLWVAGLSGTFIVGASLVSYLAIRKQMSSSD